VVVRVGESGQEGLHSLGGAKLSQGANRDPARLGRATIQELKQRRQSAIAHERDNRAHRSCPDLPISIAQSCHQTLLSALASKLPEGERGCAPHSRRPIGQCLKKRSHGPPIAQLAERTRSLHAVLGAAQCRHERIQKERVMGSPETAEVAPIPPHPIRPTVVAQTSKSVGRRPANPAAFVAQSPQQ